MNLVLRYTFRQFLEALCIEWRNTTPRIVFKLFLSLCPDRLNAALNSLIQHAMSPQLARK